MQEILIKNIMTALVQCASPSTPLSHVIQSMKLSHHSCLQQVSGFLREAVRKSDRVYRYGGEEILVLLPDTSRDDAHAVARRLAEGIANCRIPHEPHPLKVLSGGVSSPHDKVAEEPWHNVVRRADWTPYQAKHQGRNRIEVFFSDLPTSWDQGASPIASIG